MCGKSHVRGQEETGGHNLHGAAAALESNKVLKHPTVPLWPGSKCITPGDGPRRASLTDLTMTSSTAKQQPTFEHELGNNYLTWRPDEPAFIIASASLPGNGYQAGDLSAQLIALRDKIKLMLSLSKPSSCRPCWTGRPTARLVHPSLDEFAGAHDTRTITTVMIRNVPYAYTIAELEQDLQKTGFGRCFDLLYLPMKRNQDNNLGFAFLNFMLPEHVIEFKKAFHGHVFSCPVKVRCRGHATVSVAHTQGYNANLMKLVEGLNGHRKAQPRELLLPRARVRALTDFPKDIL